MMVTGYTFVKKYWAVMVKMVKIEVLTAFICHLHIGSALPAGFLAIFVQIVFQSLDFGIRRELI